MNPLMIAKQPAASESDSGLPLVSELLILPDGRILVHNLTPAFADALAQLNPDDDQIRPRARQKKCIKIARS